MHEATIIIQRVARLYVRIPRESVRRVLYAMNLEIIMLRCEQTR